MPTYLAFYELEKPPFETGDRRGLVLGTPSLRAAFAQIRCGLEEGAPRICLNGGAGMGKTSLARALPKLLGDDARVALLRDPTPPWPVLRSELIHQLGLEGGALSRRTLIAARSEGKRLLLVIDQAEKIARETLDHLDILLGYRTDDDEQLLHCVLLADLSLTSGDPEHPLLWWLDELNTLQLEYAPIPPTGIESYIQKQMKRAGWAGDRLFSEEAVRAIHRRTGGVPRAVSKLADRALGEAAQRGLGQIGPELIEALGEAISEASEPPAGVIPGTEEGPVEEGPVEEAAEEEAEASEQTPNAVRTSAGDDDRRDDREDGSTDRAKGEESLRVSGLDSYFAGPRPTDTASPAIGMVDEESDDSIRARDGEAENRAEDNEPPIWTEAAGVDHAHPRHRARWLTVGLVVLVAVAVAAAWMARPKPLHSRDSSARVAFSQPQHRPAPASTENSKSTPATEPTPHVSSSTHPTVPASMPLLASRGAGDSIAATPRKTAASLPTPKPSAAAPGETSPPVPADTAAPPASPADSADSGGENHW